MRVCTSCGQSCRQFDRWHSSDEPMTAFNYSFVDTDKRVQARLDGVRKCGWAAAIQKSVPNSCSFHRGILSIQLRPRKELKISIVKCRDKGVQQGGHSD